LTGHPGRTGWLGQWRYAHRGLHGPYILENSLAAARAAIARGLGIECDIQLSADACAMVFHDWEMERLTAEAGPVRERSAAELGTIAIAAGGEPIPTLAALLAEVAGRVPLLIEVKSRREIPVAPICHAISRVLADYRGLHAVMSFDPRVCRWFARHSPDTVRGMVVTQANDRNIWSGMKLRLAFHAARAEFLAIDVLDLPSAFATSMRRSGFPVLCWTVRDQELAARAACYADAPIAEGEGFS